MKKIFYIFIVIFISVNIVCNIYMFQIKGHLEQKVEKLNSEVSPTYDYLNSLTIRNFQSSIEKEETLIVYIGRPDCSDCNFFEPVFREIVNKYMLFDKIYYLNVKKYRENNNEDTWNEFKQKYGFTQTPAIIYYVNGKVYSMIEWDTTEGLTEERFSRWLLENDIIQYLL